MIGYETKKQEEEDVKNNDSALFKAVLPFGFVFDIASPLHNEPYQTDRDAFWRNGKESCNIEYHMARIFYRNDTPFFSFRN